MGTCLKEDSFVKGVLFVRRGDLKGNVRVASGCFDGRLNCHLREIVRRRNP